MEIFIGIMSLILIITVVSALVSIDTSLKILSGRTSLKELEQVEENIVSEEDKKELENWY